MENPFEIIVERLDRIEAALSEINTRLEQPAKIKENSSEIIRIEEAAEFLRVAKSTVYEYIYKKIIPHYKVDKKLYFKKDELVDWITKRRVKTVYEIHEEAEAYMRRTGRK